MISFLLSTFVSLAFAQLGDEPVAEAAPVGTIQYYQDGLKPLLHQMRPQSMGPELALSGSQNEILNFTFEFTPKSLGNACFELEWVARFPFKLYEIQTITTKRVSYRGAHLGKWLDPLIPLKNGRFCTQSGNSIWLLGEINIPKNSLPGRFELPVMIFEMEQGEIRKNAQGRPDFTRSKIVLKVWDNQWDDKPSLPLYSELTTWYVLLGHHGRWAAGEQELSKLYLDKMLEHRIVPLKHWVKVPHDLTPPEQQEFLTQVSRPLPPWALISAPNGMNRTSGDQLILSPQIESYYTRLNQFLRGAGILSRSFLYYWDEPDAEALPVMKRRLPLIKRAAPDLKIMVTTTYKPDLAPWIDIFAPVLNQFDVPHFPRASTYMTGSRKSWLYVSCMSHGCDSDDDSGTPDFMIDRGEEYIRSFAWIGQLYYPRTPTSSGVNGLLYYSVNNGFRTYPTTDPWESQWDFSGNGDGTLFYPGRPGIAGLTEHMPIESLRLKIWRQASYDVEYLLKIKSETSPQAKAIQELIARTVRGPMDWNKNNLTYQDIRKRIGDFIDSN